MTTEDDVTVLPIDPLVLVVDDELTPRAIVTRMVRSLGYRARSCQSGRGALRYLKSHAGQVQLLLADLGMPRMDGGELTERAKDLDPSLIVVLMAGPTDPHVGDLLSGYGDLPFVPKPVSFSDLAEKLERLLGIPAQPTSPPRSMAAARRRERRHPSGSKSRPRD
jgi:two-component system, cell cycle sensor histidine kinase and response regulator CckA